MILPIDACFQTCPSHQFHDVGSTGDICLTKGNAIDSAVRVGAVFRQRLDTLFHAPGIGGDVVLCHGKRQRQD
jgi:hypothetical protein